MKRLILALSMLIAGTALFAQSFFERTRSIQDIPGLLASTYIGSDEVDWIETVCLDAAGNIYVAGWTASTEFPVTANAYDTSFNGWADVFIAKFDADLTTLLAATFIGGSSDDRPLDMLVVSDGIYVCGKTNSTDFPSLSSAHDPVFSGFDDGFIVKFDLDLTALQAMTFVGGASALSDWVWTLAEGPGGSIYAGGLCGSSDFPVPPTGAYPVHQYNDGFVLRYDANLSTVQKGTFAGGSETEEIFDIEIAPDGTLYAIGITWSTDLPFPSMAFDTILSGAHDGMILRFDADLETHLGGTLVGGHTYDVVEALAIRGDDVYITGYTDSDDFPVTPDGYDTNFSGSREAFVSRFSPNLDLLEASTFIGGSSNEWARGVCVDPDAVFVYGITGPGDFPVPSDALDTTAELVECFAVRLSGNLETLEAATYLGGEESDFPFHGLLTEDGDLLLVGETISDDFPVSTSAYDGTFNGQRDGFITLLDPSLQASVVSGVEAGPGETTVNPFSAGPNPFTNELRFTVQLDAPQACRLVIYDITGRVLAKHSENVPATGVHHFNLRLNDGPDGMYLYRFEFGNQIVGGQLIRSQSANPALR